MGMFTLTHREEIYDSAILQRVLLIKTSVEPKRLTVAGEFNRSRDMKKHRGSLL